MTFQYIKYNNYMGNFNSYRGNPSVLSRAIAPVARVWQDTQDGIARIFGFKNNWNLTWTVTGVWLATIIAATTLVPAAPLLAAWTNITVAWVLWMVENRVTKNLASSDGKR